MEETEESNANRKCNTITRSFRGRTNPQKHQFQHQLLQYSNQFGICNQNQYHRYYPALLPLPPPIPLQLALAPPLPLNHGFRSKTRLQKPSCRLNNPPFAASSETQVPNVTISPGNLLKPSPFLQFFPSSIACLFFANETNYLV